MTQTLLPWSKAYLKKVVPPSELTQKVLEWKTQTHKIVTLNGSFDLLHVGHLHIIFEASQLGDLLIVALNSDSSIKKYKSPGRPLLPLQERLQFMAALSFVDYVTWFEETTPCHILSIIQPHIHVNGMRYGPECIEADIVKKGGGILHLASEIPGFSTTDLITKIKQL